MNSTELHIRHSPRCHAERSYILDIVLGEFLGVKYTTEVADVEHVEFELNGSKLVVDDTFFQLAERHWLLSGSLPARAPEELDVREAMCGTASFDMLLPVFYGRPEISFGERVGSIGIDIFGTVFVFLTRYEEAVNSMRDAHDRFPASASFVRREKLLLQPIVDEYVEFLWLCMSRLWPPLCRIRREFRMLVTCDVDHPYRQGTKYVSRLARQLAGDVFRRRSLSSAVGSVANHVSARRGDYSEDPYYSRLYWMMDANERAGNRMAFYFIADNNHRRFDGCYSIEEPVVRRLLRDVDNRGHEIGLHPSYLAYRDSDRIRSEKYKLERVLEKDGITQRVIGGRQHYLRWDARQSPRDWDRAGLSYDSTLAFADHIGFRCGTCFDFPLYDLIGRSRLSIREKPLVVMESTVLNDAYMGLGFSEKALDAMIDLKNICKKYAGQFTLLWHNSSFTQRAAESMYIELIE